MKKPSFQFGPVLRISVGLISLTIALTLVLGSIFEIFPSERKQLLQVRQKVTRIIGDQVIVFLADGDIAKLQRALEQMPIHDPEILSIAVRRADGAVIGASRKHDEYWRPPENGVPSLTHIPMPIFINKVRWGDVELTFSDPEAITIKSWLRSPDVVLTGFFLSIGFAAFYFYLRRALQYLDPAQAVPERVRKAFDTLTEGVLILDTKARIMLANSSFRQFHPEASERLDGKPAVQFNWLIDGLSPEEVAEEGYPWDVVIQTNRTILGKRLKIDLPDGSVRELMMNCSAISDGAGIARGCLISFADVTKLSQTLHELELSRDKIKEQNEELKKLAHFDPMTGCLNRRAFFAQAEALYQDAVANNKNAACIMTDIDHFKSFNDRYGHAVGDMVIKQVATTLGRALRTQDLLCRYGGEEFCIFLVDVHIDLAFEIGERMRASIEKDAGPGVRTIEGLRITSSFGVASTKTGNKTLAEMIDQADQELYKSKKAGRNKVTRASIEAEGQEQAAPTGAVET